MTTLPRTTLSLLWPMRIGDPYADLATKERDRMARRPGSIVVGDLPRTAAESKAKAAAWNAEQKRLREEKARADEARDRQLDAQLRFAQDEAQAAARRRSAGRRGPAAAPAPRRGAVLDFQAIYAERNGRRA